MSASTTTTTASADDKRVILVTGANKGIGYETVKQLAQQLPKATILLGTRSVDNGDQALQRMKADDPTTAFARVHPIVIDVTDLKSIAKAVEQVRSTFGRLDILINNSGISNPRRRPQPPGHTDRQRRRCT